MKLLSMLVCMCVLFLASHVTLAQTKNPSGFKVKAIINEGKKSKEKSSQLTFNQENVTVLLKGATTPIKAFNYSDIVAADYSHSKKPLLSTGGAVAMAILTGLLVLPFLFLKKKAHWLTLRTADDYIVMKLDGDDHKQILAECEIKNVKVTTIEDEKGK